MSDLESFLTQLREKRSNLQVRESVQEISVFSGTLTGILCAGVWLGSFFSPVDARRVAQIGLGSAMVLVGAAWLGHNRTEKKLDENWEHQAQIKRIIASASKNARKCPSCKYYSEENRLTLGCAVNPAMPPNCPDFESWKNQVEFQDTSGLNVVVQGASDSEVQEIREIVYRIFN